MLYKYIQNTQKSLDCSFRFKTNASRVSNHAFIKIILLNKANINDGLLLIKNVPKIPRN